MEDEIGFTLQGLKTEQFAMFEENFSKKKESNIATSITFKSNQEQKQIGVFTTFTFEQTKKAF